MIASRQQVGAGLTKVTFLLSPGEWHGSATESLWAQPVGHGLYRLDNSPFFAFGVSYHDVVLVREETDRLVFVQAVKRGGHSTYRLLLTEAGRAKLVSAWSPFREAGCSYEEGPSPLLTVDVPPEADIHEVYRLLDAGEEMGLWSFEEGHCGHSVG